MIHIVVLSSQKKKSQKYTTRPKLFQKKVIINEAIRSSDVEYIGAELRMHMSAMKPIL